MGGVIGSPCFGGDRACTEEMRTTVMLSAYAYSDLPPAAFAYRTSCGYTWEDARAGLGDWVKIHNSRTDAQAVCAYEERTDTCWIAFRGTDSLLDAKTNINVRKITVHLGDGSRVRVHRGFYGQFKSVMKNVYAFVDRHPSRKAFVVTGHSLGGALATLCSLFLSHRFPGVPVRATVYGCPRVGTRTLGAALRGRGVGLERVKVGADPVTDIPTRLRWVHGGKLLRFVRGRLVESPRCGDPLVRCLALPNPFRTPDHRMDAYADAVTAAAPRPAHALGRRRV